MLSLYDEPTADHWVRTKAVKLIIEKFATSLYRSAAVYQSRRKFKVRKFIAPIMTDLSVKCCRIVFVVSNLCKNKFPITRLARISLRCLWVSKNSVYIPAITEIKRIKCVTLSSNFSVARWRFSFKSFRMCFDFLRSADVSVTLLRKLPHWNAVI